MSGEGNGSSGRKANKARIGFSISTVTVLFFVQIICLMFSFEANGRNGPFVKVAEFFNDHPTLKEWFVFITAVSIPVEGLIIAISAAYLTLMIGMG
eukprot:gnl/Chilomastix_caulleri/5035.p1 GENE.gnl/Chilomastix_caulleri/5035~~gnl/Chilomastix_caulleri/5035.p1  ORF type:complete len:96 (-),score=13.52 gnl/Chilomastix_caulleri/5035:19-306(-)